MAYPRYNSKEDNPNSIEKGRAKKVKQPSVEKSPSDLNLREPSTIYMAEADYLAIASSGISLAQKVRDSIDKAMAQPIKATPSLIIRHRWRTPLNDVTYDQKTTIKTVVSLSGKQREWLRKEALRQRTTRSYILHKAIQNNL